MEWWAEIVFWAVTAAWIFLVVAGVLRRKEIGLAPAIIMSFGFMAGMAVVALRLLLNSLGG